jgi:hypothetical protein
MNSTTRAVAGVLLVSVAVIAAGGCYSTNIRESWAAPDLQPPLDFDKMLVVFMDPTERTRRAAEESLVRRLGDDRAVASYTLLTGDEVENAEANRDAIRQELDAAGFDAAVTMRLVSEEQTLNYTPGMTYPAYYGGFYGYYGWGWGYAYSPGYVSTDTVVSVETNLYSLDEDRLIWSGVTETFNPGDIGSMVNDIADAVVDNLRRRGLID